MSALRMLAAAAALAAAACGAARTPPRTEAAPDPRPMEGTVAVVTTGTSSRGDGCGDARACAQRDAMRAVLFVGVPDTPLARPIVPDEQDALRRHRAFFDALLGRDGYARYVVRVAPTASVPGAREGEKSWTVVINTDALRRALEDAGVVRRFGY